MIVVYVDKKPVASLYHKSGELWEYHAHDYKTRMLFHIDYIYDRIRQVYPNSEYFFQP